MRTTRPGAGPVLAFALLLPLGACGDGSHSPPGRPEVTTEQMRSEDAGNPAPLDLVYVCGNKFLALNSTKRTVHLTYRVVGTSEVGGVTLSPGPIEDPGFSETELETTSTGIVELYRDEERIARRRKLKLI